MSQIQSFASSMGPGGPILTLTGDLGPAVGPDAGGNINIQSIPSVGVNYGLAAVVTQISNENPAAFPANTLKIEPLHDLVTTSDAVATVFVNTEIIISPSEAWVMNATVIGARSDYTEACGGFVTGVARRAAAGSAALSGQQPLVSDDAVGFPTFGVTVVGNSFFVFAQGLAGQTWNWTCTYTFQKLLI